MKKVFVLVTTAVLVSGMTFTQDSTNVKRKKAMFHSGKTCQKPAKPAKS